MKRKRHKQRVKKLMNHALNEAIRIGFFALASGAEGVAEAQGAEITIGDKNTVINWSDTGKGDLRFNVWWDYTPQRCRLSFRKRKLRDLRGIMPDVSSAIRPRIMGFCASCYLCVLEDGRIRLSREGEMTVEYARVDTAHLLDDLPDVEPSGY
ncbi:hypothetical protein AABH71_005190 [Salmonella enterica]|uniref:hypothetical protein n=1 Tax=Salmonella enterica TaxID=28901 RepID=UPI0012F3477E|nr:hypothetical protein [Salmonella enterica]EBQ9004849.1 hypothetical protein [Salmonella enterica subsp. enterica serovar Blockley]ECS7527613.1 hypothetical protein [Salmonella enterica]ECW2124788.1 hypothetical protein [Salmonella enterica]